ncbi:MAG TPA: hypothetical protein PLV06_11650 [Bacteroidales bacterium]|nr:hypothetical protein [Bacteroidales bacterium]HPJ59803.1 hypothetical protein [Bacteroidales bacterium]HPR13031.1 hypothetical protein [Bacteroidales bacterium]
MDFNKTVDLIIRDLEEATEIIDDFKNYPGVPVIQVEMAKAKCRNAAGVIALLKDIPEQPGESQKKKTEQIPSEAAGPEEKEQIAKKQPPQEKEIVSKVEKHVSIDEEVHHKIPESIKPGIFADTFGSPSDRLNESLGGMRDKDDTPGYFNAGPLTKFADAIGINDRFLFVRELFDGNTESYNELIRQLDLTSSLSEARGLLETFTGDKVKTEPGMQLLDLIKRKFRGNE